MSTHFFWIIFAYVIISLICWKASDEEEYDILYPLNKPTKWYLRIPAWILFLCSVVFLGIVIYSIIDSKFCLLFFGLILFVLTLYEIRKNKLLERIASNNPDNRENEKFAHKRSLITIIVGVGCAITLPLGAINLLYNGVDSLSGNLSKAETIKEITQLGKLATLHTDVKKVIEPHKAFASGRIEASFLYSRRAYITTGVDLTLITSDDVSVDKNSIKLRLPFPSIISEPVIPLECGDILYKQDKGRKITAEDRHVADIQFEQMLNDELFLKDLFEQTKQPTILFFRHFLSQLGFDEIEITFE